ncbi:MAG: prepilin peptidase [Terracidiphilus sp.]|jgi:leader peptidase (prepilin peptidase)/N-methyltransferase
MQPANRKGGATEPLAKSMIDGRLRVPTVFAHEAVYSISSMIRILGTIFAGLLGLAFGSFLNVCLSRWPEGESIVQPRSHCRQCGRTLTWWENVPLVSWLALRGRCRTCHAWIGWRYPLVELAVGVLWAVPAWQFLYEFFWPYFPSRLSFFQSCVYYDLAKAVGMAAFYWLLIALAVLDAEHLWLPNFLTLPGIAAGFLLLAFGYEGAVELDSFTRSVPYSFPYSHWGQWIAPSMHLLSILVAAGLILLIRWLYWLFRHREGIGLGDAKLMALLAAWLGLPGALLAFGIGVMLGALAAVVLLAVPSARRGSESWAMSKLPFGTFLCIGGIVSSLWGQPILAAYLSWAGF